MIQESPWFKKALDDIRATDKERRDMEKHFSYESLDDYQELNRKEAVEATELLKFGVDNHIEGDSVILEFEKEKFKVPKEALQDELGIEQYNFLVNNADEVDPKAQTVEDNEEDTAPPKDSTPQEADKEKPEKKQTTELPDLKLPDGRTVPSALAPMMLFSKAMEQTVSFYMSGGKVQDGFAQPKEKPKSKTTNELLRNISEIQQQVLLLEDEKQRASNGTDVEAEELRSENESLEAQKREAEKTIDRLKRELEDIRENREEEDKKTVARLKEASGALQEKDRQLKDAQEVLKATQFQIAELKKKANSDAADAEAKLKDAVQKAVEDAQKEILDRKDSEIKDLESDYNDKIAGIQKDYEDRISSLKDANLSGKDRIDALSSNIEELSADKAEKEKALKELEEKHNAELESLKKEHETEIERVRSQSQSSADKVKEDIEGRFKSQLEDLKKKKADAEAEAEKLRAESERLKNESEKLKHESARLKNESDRLRADTKNMKDKISTLSEDANTDILTGVKNERALNNDIGRLSPQVIARIMILGMKTINTRDGFDTGNSVISLVADSLNNDFPGKVYRTLGDQFVVFAENYKDARSKIEALKDDLISQGIYIAFNVASGRNAYQKAKDGAEKMHDDIYEELSQEQTEEETGESEDDLYGEEGEEDAAEESDEEDADTGDDDSYDDSDGDDEAEEPDETEESDEDDDDVDEDELLAQELSEGEEL